MDVTVEIAPALRCYCEGRASLTLGVPAGTSSVEVLATVLSLYPKLEHCVLSDMRHDALFFSIAGEAQRLVLFAQRAKM
jgi:hypothetical protein